jgi:hypothetical protein
MNAKRRRRHEPAIESFRGDDALAIQDAGCRRRGRHGLIECRRHRRLSLQNFL